MKGLILKLEPVIWFLFGGGFMVGCLLFPAFIVAYGIAAPFGFLPEEAISYERMHAIASSLPGRLVLGVMIVFPLWNGLNHLRHFAIDLSGRQARRLVRAAVLRGRRGGIGGGGGGGRRPLAPAFAPRPGASGAP